MREHHYHVTTTWTGNLGEGTRTYRGYSRDHEVRSAGAPALAGSADPAFRGDAHRWNPEQLLVTALSQCHMLWFLHLCADAGVVVVEYRDDASGSMVEDADGGGRFTEVTLRPHVRVAEASMLERAEAQHATAHRRCYIASSVAFEVRHEPHTTTTPLDASVEAGQPGAEA